MTTQEKIEHLSQLFGQRAAIDKEIETLIGTSESRPEKVKKIKKAKAKIVKKKAIKKPEKKRGRKAKLETTQDVIDQIIYMRDEEGMTSKAIADELEISLSVVNQYFRPVSSEHEIG